MTQREHEEPPQPIPIPPQPEQPEPDDDDDNGDDENGDDEDVVSAQHPPHPTYPAPDPATNPAAAGAWTKMRMANTGTATTKLEPETSPASRRFLDGRHRMVRPAIREEAFMHDGNIQNESMTSTVLAWTVVVAAFAIAVAMVWLS